MQKWKANTHENMVQGTQKLERTAGIHLLDNAEQIDICIVDGEIQKNGPCCSCNP